MDWTVSTLPTSLPFEWQRHLKPHLKIDFDDERDLILDYQRAAVAHAEEILSCSLMPQEITATYQSGDDLVLPRGPVISITEVIDDDGTTFDDVDVVGVGRRQRLQINTGNPIYPLTVTYEAGFAPQQSDQTHSIDADILGMIRQHITTLHQSRALGDEKTAKAIEQLDASYRAKGRGSFAA